MENLKKEILEISVKTALSAIPIGGTLATCVWDSVKSNAMQKRFEEWQKLLEKRLTNLEFTLNDIGNNEAFTTALMKATDSAIKTAETSKREYLANAVLNSLTTDVNESIMMIYLGFIDSYTLLHIKALNFFENPEKFEVSSKYLRGMGAPITVLCEVYPEFKQNNSITNKIIGDLYSDGLLNTKEMNTTMTGTGVERHAHFSSSDTLKSSIIFDL